MATQKYANFGGDPYLAPAGTALQKHRWLALSPKPSAEDVGPFPAGNS